MFDWASKQTRAAVGALAEGSLLIYTRRDMKNRHKMVRIDDHLCKYTPSQNAVQDDQKPLIEAAAFQRRISTLLVQRTPHQYLSLPSTIKVFAVTERGTQLTRSATKCLDVLPAYNPHEYNGIASMGQKRVDTFMGREPCMQDQFSWREKGSELFGIGNSGHRAHRRIHTRWFPRRSWCT